MKPLCIDLFCGLGGWAEGFLAEGYDVVGFDNGHTAPYGPKLNSLNGLSYPGHLVLQDVLTLHGSQFRNAACIVASPPCQNYSYLAMPWSRSKSDNSQAAKALRRKWETEGPDNRLFDACFRLQREANIATGYICETCGAPDEGRTVMVRPAGYSHSDDLAEHDPCPDCLFKSKRFIPLIVENVRGAQPWVGRAAWSYGSFYLWGDVPALMPFGTKRKGTKPVEGRGWTAGTAITLGLENYNGAQKVPGFRFDGSGRSFQSASVTATEAVKIGGDWFRDPACHSRHGSRSSARRIASAMIAKIPFELARHIANVYKPR